MNIIDIKKNCIGCGACIDVCPLNILVLDENEFGFYEPKIERDNCISCKKCINYCVINNKKTVNNDLKNRLYFYGWIKNDLIRKESTSGGLFTAIAQYVINKNGIIIGARYSDDFKYVLMDSTENCSIDSLRKSKYCQSNYNGVYKKISSYLKLNKIVLMVGTPCQIAAAKRIFKNNENLILVDFLCGGAATTKAYKDYILFLEKKYKSKIKYINMRDKSFGWNNSSVKIIFENNKKILRPYQFDMYNSYYYSCYLKNEECFNCNFIEHNDADFTIADFWGYRNKKIKAKKNGISLLCVNTNKGEKILDEIKSNVFLNELDYESVKYIYNKKNISNSDKEKRLKILESIKDNGFVYTAKKDMFKGGKICRAFRLIKNKVIKK